MTKEQVYQALLSNKEAITEYSDGTIWAEVYIPNIGSSHQIAGFLSVLTKEGRYRPVSKDFGQVIIRVV